MRVWTIQPYDVWEQMHQNEAIYVDPERTGAPPSSYLWLVEKLQQRIPGYEGHLPWWAYCKKPDLRYFRHRQPRGQHVRLELELTPKVVMTIPRDAWDRVYCGNYLAFSPPESYAWFSALREAVPDEEIWPLPEPWKSRLEASWERLFHPDVIATMPYCSVCDGPCMEAVFEKLRMEDVRTVTTFLGVSKWRSL